MCGIAGILDWTDPPSDSTTIMTRMLSSLGHRGPDGKGIYVDDRITLGHSRLSIIDLEGGFQPMSNEDQSLWLVCNGEIFNYIELAKDLTKKGHRFKTHTDVEVLLHLYEDHKEKLFDHVNGQYAFAIWDRREESLLLARDHVGICPLFFCADGSRLVFGSEIKAFIHLKDIRLELDYRVLSQIFAFWAPLPGLSPFKNIFEIKPGCYMRVTSQGQKESRYWLPSFPQDKECTSTESIKEELYELLLDASKIRLRADVPVGAYLSGGLDSSITTALIRKNNNRLRTFSIGFEDPDFDETSYQNLLSNYLKTDHSYFRCENSQIWDTLREVIWHTEKPVLRTAPVPLFKLSAGVRQSGYKVVLTGEGADEFFAGYNIYKETKLRLFNAEHPSSRFRPLLFNKLYPYLKHKDGRADNFWQNYFLKNYTDTTDIFYSHTLRWQHGAFISNFLHPDIKMEIENYEPAKGLKNRLNGILDDYPPMARAFFLEVYLFLGNYLLNSQGDRMLMSHSVEGRYPFLDRRVIDFASTLPQKYKLKALNEKWILKKTFAGLLPPEISKRVKKPYRAPIAKSLYAADESVKDYLLEKRLSECGVFDTRKVMLFSKKFESHSDNISAREEMALMAILTTQILVDLFIRHPSPFFRNNDAPCKILDFRTHETE